MGRRHGRHRHPLDTTPDLYWPAMIALITLNLLILAALARAIVG